MTNEVTATIHKTSGIAAAIAAILSPIPLADEIVLLPIYGVLSRRIGRAHGLKFLEIPWKPISFTTFNGLAARAGLNLAVSFIPGVAAVANAASAVLLTQFLGRYIAGVCENPTEAKTMGVGQILDLLRKRKAEEPVATATAN